MNINWLNVKNIYMIGIKGVGMTMLGQFLADKNYNISGSDVTEVFMTDSILSQHKIKVFSGFSESNLDFNNIDLIIYSTAYSAERNPEVAAALISNVPVLTYAQAMGEVFNKKHGIAVCGSHGKTTTTAWLGFVLRESGCQPNVMVGSKVPQFNGASLVGPSDYLVIEADEYQNKLQYFQPKMIVLNNIDYDHPDFYPTVASYEQAFADFMDKLDSENKLVTNFDDETIVKLVKTCSGEIISYAIKNLEADYVASDVVQEGNEQVFSLKHKNSNLGRFKIKLSGEHNIYNALAVIVASLNLGVDIEKIRLSLGEFIGTARRAQVLGQFNGAMIIDDYAHHPTEVKSTITGLRQKYPYKKIITVFHPHTFTRTKSLFKDFIRCFNETDELLILEIYGSAREEQGGISSQDLVLAVKRQLTSNCKLKKVDYVVDLKTCEQVLRTRLNEDYVLILMGAGDVFRVGENLIKNL